MPRLTDKQISDARNVTLLDYMQKHEPGNVKSVRGRFIHKNHDSFVIDNGKGQWFWNSKGVGGFSAVDYLMKIENMDFRAAVLELTGGEDFFSVRTNATNNSREKLNAHDSEKLFQLPAAGASNTRVVNYLQNRGIDKNTIYKCINRGLLYENKNGNCVFVGRDKKDGNKPKYAAERSTWGSIKKDVAGSDKRFGFCLPPDNSSTNLAVFESPIDALSHADLIGLAGTEWDGHRLSLGGVASKALDEFLSQHPEITHIWLCLDKDKAGYDANKRIINEILQDSRYADKKITVSIPPLGKDWGDSLVAVRQMQRDLSKEKQASQGQSLSAQGAFDI